MLDRTPQCLAAIGNITLVTTVAGVAFGAMPAPRRVAPTTEHRVVIEGGAVIGSVRWVAGTIYELRGRVRVAPGATLTIEAGVRVEAQQGGQIVVSRTGRISARGTLLEPVVFSCKTEQQFPGCWDGIVIQGFAPLNTGQATSPPARGNGQGGCREIQDAETGELFGGCDPADDSGRLSYVRIEYARLTGLRLAGVGSATIVDHIQVHQGLADAVAAVGGTVNLRYLALMSNSGAGLHWSTGWTGKAQFILMHLNLGAGPGVGGMVGENLVGAANSLPRSAPQIYNVSILAAAAMTSPARAIVLAAGTAATLRNILIYRMPVGLDVRDAETCVQLAGGALTLTRTVLAGVTSVGDPDADPVPCSTFTSPSAESGFLQAPASANQILTGDVSGLVLGASSLALLDGRPTVALAGATPPSDGFFDPQAAFAGALPSTSATVTIPWHSGWTAPAVEPAANPVAAGPLRVSTQNPRYFATPSGAIVYLTGSHYWKNVQDNGTTNPPPAFDNVAYLNFLQQHNHNFTRLWVWEQARWSPETAVSHWFSPTIYVRSGPGTALDGGPRFDLAQVNPAYLARLRQRVMDAGARGIYVSVMLFDGWSIGTKPGYDLQNPWRSHAFNAANNINGINGDPNSFNSGVSTHTLDIPAVTALQEAYVRAVVDAVNDLDNVMFEISNESDGVATPWQYHMIDVVRAYEQSKPKQHPIGMTKAFPNMNDADLTQSSAEWISTGGDPTNPSVASGSKVSLFDTDHLCGICGDATFPWRSLTRGHNPLFMDGYDGSAGLGDPVYNPADPVWEAIRKNLGYARSYAVRMDLAMATPRGNLVSSGYCLAKLGSGAQFLVFVPGGGNVTVNLAGISGSLGVEWFNPATGQATVAGSVTGGATRTFTPSFGGDAVLFLH